MSSQLKLLLYIIFIAGIFYFIQNRFNLFDISFIEDIKIEKLFEDSEKSEDVEDGVRDMQIAVGDGKMVNLKVEIADTNEKRALGLSLRKYLGDYEGMYFVFEQNTNTSFWMKDMLIPLDIIFIDETGFIVDIKESQQTCTSSCPYIFSSSTYRYVLEVNSGFCSTNGVKIGNRVLVNLK
ncbi:MAG: DUF192 domain-containing protein [Candidatus Dojkabacteria bacterium]|nr:DUF192 domain-containing protein [Candidatus Dojkabacteria bacterium]